jgi:hypothetical protein
LSKLFYFLALLQYQGQPQQHEWQQQQEHYNNSSDLSNSWYTSNNREPAIEETSTTAGTARDPRNTIETQEA